MKVTCFVFVIVALIAMTFADGEGDRRPSMCNQPIELGACEETIYKYGYDTNVSQCKRFAYSGCGGNANRFDTLSECRKTCETK